MSAAQASATIGEARMHSSDKKGRAAKDENFRPGAERPFASRQALACTDVECGHGSIAPNHTRVQDYFSDHARHSRSVCGDLRAGQGGSNPVPRKRQEPGRLARHDERYSCVCTMSSVDDLFKGCHFDREIMTFCVRSYSPAIPVTIALLRVTLEYAPLPLFGLPYARGLWHFSHLRTSIEREREGGRRRGTISFTT